jgi:hypothetical protein
MNEFEKIPADSAFYRRLQILTKHFLSGSVREAFMGPSCRDSDANRIFCKKIVEDSAYELMNDISNTLSSETDLVLVKVMTDISQYCFIVLDSQDLYSDLEIIGIWDESKKRWLK